MFFNNHEGDVVGLRHALSEILNGFQEPLLDRATSRGGLSLNDFQQPFLSEHFFLRVFSVRKSVGIHHQNVSFVEAEHAGLIGGGIEYSQGISVGGQRLDISRGGAEQIGWIMSRADELPCAIRAQQKEKKRDELGRKRFFAKEQVYPVQDFLRLTH